MISVQEQNRIEKAIASEGGRLLGFIKGKVRRSEDAEDILQDVYVKLINTTDRIGSIDSLGSWMYRVAKNLIIDRYRKKKEEFIAPNGDADLNLYDFLPALSDDSPEDSMLRNLIWDAIQQGLDEMPKEQSDVFKWHELEGKSFKEIESSIGVTQNTLMSRKRYAVLFLRKRLESTYKEVLAD